MNSQAVREFLDRLEETHLTPEQRGRANKVGGQLARIAQYLEVEERSGLRPRDGKRKVETEPAPSVEPLEAEAPTETETVSA